jgi:lactate permease
VSSGLVAALPFVLVPALIVSGRAGALAAGVAGLLAALAALLVLRGGDTATSPLLIGEVISGVWLSVQAVAFIVGGLFFYLCISASQSGFIGAPRYAEEAGNTGLDRRRLYWACFLLGPFAESATGFGVGMLIALPVILASGARGLTALAFSLFSQMLVAWGSLGVGSAVGAALAGVPFTELAVRSAWLQVPLLMGHLAVYWILLAGIGNRPTAAEAADDFAWTALLAIGLVLSTRHVAPELGGLLATGVLLVLRAFRDDRNLARRAGSVLRSCWPYAALTGILVATRTVASVRETLQAFWIIRPLDNEDAIAPLYHPAAWLVAVGLLALFVGGKSDELRSVTGKVARLGWQTVLVTIVYIVLARLVAAGGLADVLATEARALAGDRVIYLSPAFGAVSGLLTGSNTASNGMMMPVQAALAQATGADLAWTAALQNVAGSTLTMLSPTRIATGCALLGLVGQDRAAYARTWIFGAVAVAVLLIFWRALV